LAIALTLILLVGLLSTSVLSQDAAPAPAERSIVAPLAADSLMLDGTAIDTRIVAVGERGHVLISSDYGRTWKQAEVPSRATLTGVHFHDADLGWAVGHDATILRTTDGGRSWERVYHDPDEESPLFDIWFSNADKGFAVGAYGLFLATSDGGATWEQRLISEYDDFHLHHIARSDSGRLFIAAEFPLPTRGRSSAPCPSEATRCCCSVCAVICSVRKTPGRPGRRSRPGPWRCSAAACARTAGR
jgi:photosystem II stability/assembly factor-like uncharacterized protein